MKKSKVARVAGFVGALGLSTVLVTTAVQGTGAYFEDSAGGNLNASSGSLQISAQDTTISFARLNPGEDRSQQLTITNKSSSTTNADIWLVFDATSAAYGIFTGANDGTYTTGTESVTGSDTGMGQYGHFKVVGAAGTFESYNLKLEHATDAVGGYSSSTARNTCSVNKFGLGGSAVQHKANGGNDIANCGVPAQILLRANLAPGASTHPTITFGLTGKQQQQNQKNDPNVPFRIVATQPGVAPGQAWGK